MNGKARRSAPFFCLTGNEKFRLRMFHSHTANPLALNPPATRLSIAARRSLEEPSACRSTPHRTARRDYSPSEHSLTISLLWEVLDTSIEWPVWSSPSHEWSLIDVCVDQCDDRDSCKSCSTVHLDTNVRSKKIRLVEHFLPALKPRDCLSLFTTELLWDDRDWLDRPVRRSNFDEREIDTSF